MSRTLAASMLCVPLPSSRIAAAVLSVLELDEALVCATPIDQHTFSSLLSVAARDELDLDTQPGKIVATILASSNDQELLAAFAQHPNKVLAALCSREKFSPEKKNRWFRSKNEHRPSLDTSHALAHLATDGSLSDTAPEHTRSAALRLLATCSHWEFLSPEQAVRVLDELSSREELTRGVHPFQLRAPGAAAVAAGMATLGSDDELWALYARFLSKNLSVSTALRSVRSLHALENR